MYVLVALQIELRNTEERNKKWYWLANWLSINDLFTIFNSIFFSNSFSRSICIAKATEYNSANQTREKNEIRISRGSET